MKDLYKYIKEGILDDEDVLLNDFPTDLYSLIKDRIGRITYKYTSLGFTRSINTNKCKKLSKSLDPLNPINGKLPTNGKDTFASLPILLSNIYVKPSFITHKNDASYLESSAKQSSKFIEDNDLYGTEFSRSGSLNSNNSYIFIEMVNGYLMIYYKSCNDLSVAIKPTISSITGKPSRGWGYIKITLVDPVKESILDDDDVFMDNADKALIEKFIKDNYTYEDVTISDKPNKDGKYEVSSNNDVFLNGKSNTRTLTNGLFVWKDVYGDFNCAQHKNLTSLEGAPEYVDICFYCCNCCNLLSLEGAPKNVDGAFDCRGCIKLTSLKGSPKEVGGSFNCCNCLNLLSLEGAPKEIGGGFWCKGCESLKSLKGAPKKVGGSFHCSNCKDFTENDVKKVSNVQGKIFC